MMDNDATLIQRYLDGSQPAFAELVRRHIDAVYASALRRLAGDTHLANDVTQKVFTTLAAKAAVLRGRSSIIGWLYTSAQFEASKTVRSEQRRRTREQKAHAMQIIEESEAENPDWSALRPVIDQAMGGLKEVDRDALLLRFFEARTLAQVGEALGLTENAARMRVDRALDKLREALAGHGIKSTASALTAVLSTQVVAAAPAALATTVTHTALASAATGGGAALVFMGMTKLQLGLVSVLAATGGATLWQQHAEGARLQADIAVLERTMVELEGGRTASSSQAAFANGAVGITSPAPGQESVLAALRAEAKTLREELAVHRAATRATSLPVASTASSTDAIYRLSQLDERPAPVKTVPPAYPAELKLLGIPGQVMVSLVVGSDGIPEDLRVEQATHEAFGEEAKKAAQQWRFKPGMKDEKAVRTKVTVPFRFSLESNSPNWF
jgi:RNA polymerase sigma factor (sigma-70 family)